MVDQIAGSVAQLLKNSGTGSANDIKAGDDLQSGSDFLSLLKTSAGGAIDSLKAGESASAAAIAGNASLPEVVSAVNAAEMTLQTVVAVRDKLVGAYQDLMRMAI